MKSNRGGDEPGINPLAQNMQALRAGQPRRGFQELSGGFNPCQLPAVAEGL